MGIWKCAESWVIAALLLMTTIYHFNLLTFLSLISRLCGCCLSSTYSGSKQRHVLELQKSYFQQKFTCVGLSLVLHLFVCSVVCWLLGFFFKKGKSFSFTWWFYLSIFFYNFTSVIFQWFQKVLHLFQKYEKCWQRIVEVSCIKFQGKSPRASEEKLLLGSSSSEHPILLKWWALTRFQQEGIFFTPYWDLRHRNLLWRLWETRLFFPLESWNGLCWKRS